MKPIPNDIFTTYAPQRIESEDVEELIKIVEANGHGSITKFFHERNMPYCLPEFVAKSCGLWSYRNGEWWAHYIYDGRGDPIEIERPH